MENLYTVQKTYEALTGSVQENDPFRIFNNEYERQMYHAGLTKASVQSAINWLKRPESFWVADHDKMLQLLREKLGGISQINKETRQQIKECVDFSKEQNKVTDILISLTDTKSTDIHTDTAWQVTYKWLTPTNPTVAMVRWSQYTTIWWEITENKRAVYIMDTQTSRINTSFIIAQNNTIVEQKPPSAIAQKNIAFIPPISYTITSK